MFRKTIWFSEFGVTGSRCEQLNTLKLLSPDVKWYKC